MFPGRYASMKAKAGEGLAESGNVASVEWLAARRQEQLTKRSRNGPSRHTPLRLIQSRPKGRKEGRKEGIAARTRNLQTPLCDLLRHPLANGSFVVDVNDHSLAKAGTWTWLEKGKEDRKKDGQGLDSKPCIFTTVGPSLESYWTTGAPISYITQQFSALSSDPRSVTFGGCRSAFLSNSLRRQKGRVKYLRYSIGHCNPGTNMSPLPPPAAALVASSQSALQLFALWSDSTQKTTWAGRLMAVAADAQRRRRPRRYAEGTARPSFRPSA